jgi:hypothetical protein
MHDHILPRTTADDLEERHRLQRIRANACICCDAPGDICAADERTPLCARCWLAIYGDDA